MVMAIFCRHRTWVDLLLNFNDPTYWKTWKTWKTWNNIRYLDTERLDTERLDVEIMYDTSFLKRKQVVISGDVESNPGPVSSIESYRAAIGRFSGKARYVSQNKTFQKVGWVDVTLFLFVLTFLQLLSYVVIVTTMYAYLTEFVALMMLTITYGYSCLIVYQGSELLSRTFEKLAKKNELMRKPSLPLGTKVRTLVPCSYLHTFVLDGRDSRTETQENEIEIIDSEKVRENYNKMVSVWSCILRISFWLYVSYAVFMIGNKVSLSLDLSSAVFVALSSRLITNRQFGNLSGPKSLLILLCCFVTVGNLETPKGKGRPKKRSNVNNFARRKLDMDSACTSNEIKSGQRLETLHTSNSLDESCVDENNENRLVDTAGTSNSVDLNIDYFNNFARRKLDTDSACTSNEIKSGQRLETLHTSNSLDESCVDENNENRLVDVAGTSNSVDLNIDYSLVSADTINRKFPVKLRNEGVNVCFFNSICQVLYSLPIFHTYLEQTLIRDNVIVTELKNLFETMRSTSRIVQTSSYVRQLNLGNYRFGMQHDAEEALSEILNSCYPDDGESLFRIKLNESVVCERNLGGCGEKFDKYECHQVLKLQVQETYEQSVQHILNSPFNYHMPEGYRCNLGLEGGCHKIGSCSKASLVSELRDLLVIQLLIFSYDTYGRRRKLFPGFNVEQQITQFDDFTLQGIIWHHGQSIDSGHYTSMVKHNERWYHISDTEVDHYEIKFSCQPGEETVPYLLFYKRNNNTNVSNVSSINTLNTEIFPAEPELIDSSLRDDTINTSKEKRTFETSVEHLDDDNLNSTKRRKFEKCLDSQEKVAIDEEIENMETPVTELDEETEKFEDGSACKLDQTKRKRKLSYQEKKLRDRLAKQKIRGTFEGKEKEQETDRLSKEKNT